MGPSIASLRNNEFHFFKNNRSKPFGENVQKCQSFATLIKTSPFQKGSPKKSSPQNAKIPSSEAVISEVSTSSSLKKVESSPNQAQLAQIVRTKRVSFSEEYNGQLSSRAGGILKLRDSRRYSQELTDLYVIRPRAGSFDTFRQPKEQKDLENSEIEANMSFDMSPKRERRSSKHRDERERRSSKSRDERRRSQSNSQRMSPTHSPNKGESSKSRFYRDNAN